MICPNCKKDYRDVPKGEDPGGFYKSDDHFYKNYRRFGMRCSNCGFIAEFITKPSGLPYRKKDCLIKQAEIEKTQLNLFEKGAEDA